MLKSKSIQATLLVLTVFVHRKAYSIIYPSAVLRTETSAFFEKDLCTTAAWRRVESGRQGDTRLLGRLELIHVPWQDHAPVCGFLTVNG